MKACLPAIFYHANRYLTQPNRKHHIDAISGWRFWRVASLLLLIILNPALGQAKPHQLMVLNLADGSAVEIGHAGKAFYWKFASGAAAGAQLQLSLPEVIAWASYSQKPGPDGITATVKYKTATGRESLLKTNIVSGTALFSVSFEPSGPENAEWSVFTPKANRVVFQEKGRYGVLASDSLPASLPSGLDRLAMQSKADQQGLWLAFGKSEPARDGRAISQNDGLTVRLPIIGPGGINLGLFKGDALIALEQAGPAIEPRQEIAKGVDAWSSASPKVKQWGWFSDGGRQFAPLRADPREAAFHLGFMQNDNGETYEDVAMGGDLGILHVNLASGAKMSLTMRGLLTARFDVYSNSFDLLNADFLGGPALGYQNGIWSWEAFAYHQSSHLGDEVLEDGGRRRIDYGREVVRFLGAHSWESLRLYAGPSYVLHSLPKSSQGDWTLQAGLEYSFSLWDQPCFAATDIQSRQENDWNLNLTARVGVDLGNPQLTQNRQYIFLELFQGYSNMGQYYDTWERYAMIGIGYNFR